MTHMVQNNKISWQAIELNFPYLTWQTSKLSFGSFYEEVQEKPFEAIRVRPYILHLYSLFLFVLLLDSQ